MRQGHPISSKDPLNASEVARTIALGFRIMKLREHGKNREAARLEKRVEAIRKHAEEREAHRAKVRQEANDARRKARW